MQKCTQSVLKERRVETIKSILQRSKAKAFFAANQANHTVSPLARLPGVGKRYGLRGRSFERRAES